MSLPRVIHIRKSDKHWGNCKADPDRNLTRIQWRLNCWQSPADEPPLQRRLPDISYQGVEMRVPHKLLDNQARAISPQKEYASEETCAWLHFLWSRDQGECGEIEPRNSHLSMAKRSHCLACLVKAAICNLGKAHDSSTFKTIATLHAWSKILNKKWTKQMSRKRFTEFDVYWLRLITTINYTCM